MTNVTDQTIITEHVFEARFKAIGGFLDFRGRLADHIAANSKLVHWHIDENTINFSDEPDGIKKIGGFVSFRNAGFIAYDSPTPNFFQDQSESFWKTLAAFQSFQISSVLRLGVRTKAFLKCDLSFEKLEEKFEEKLLSAKTPTVFGSKPVDISVIADLVEQDMKMRIQTGPFHKHEANNFFKFKSTHFESPGIFVDCDVFATEVLDGKEVAKEVRKRAKMAWNKIVDVFEALEV